MTALRLISLSSHGAAEMALGFALLVAPFALGFGSAGIVIGVLAGMVLVGLALGATTLDRSSSVSAHHASDWAMVITLLAAALALGLVQETVAGLVFAGAAAVQLLLASTTRYTAH